MVFWIDSLMVMVSYERKSRSQVEIRLKLKSNVDIRHIKHTDKFLYLS